MILWTNVRFFCLTGSDWLLKESFGENLLGLCADGLCWMSIVDSIGSRYGIHKHVSKNQESIAVEILLKVRRLLRDNAEQQKINVIARHCSYSWQFASAQCSWNKRFVVSSVPFYYNTYKISLISQAQAIFVLLNFSLFLVFLFIVSMCINIFEFLVAYTELLLRYVFVYLV